MTDSGFEPRSPSDWHETKRNVVVKGTHGDKREQIVEEKTFTRLSERMKNADEVCAVCKNNTNGKCKFPILMEIYKARGSIRTSKLISFSRDGKTCQLFEEVEE